jgi:hypothetical protein
MRIVYKIALGLLLFNAFLTLFSPIFNTAVSENAIDYEAEDISQYEIKNAGDVMGIIFHSDNIGAWSAVAIVTIAGIGVAFLTKNYVYIGVTLFVSIIVGLYVKMSSVIAGIGSTYGNIYVTGLITIIGIAIGLIVIFNVIDMFAPASARE